MNYTINLIIILALCTCYCNIYGQTKTKLTTTLVYAKDSFHKHVAGFESGIYNGGKKLGIWEVADSENNIIGHRIYIDDTTKYEIQYLQGKVYSAVIVHNPIGNYQDQSFRDILYFDRKGRIKTRIICDKDSRCKSIPVKNASKNNYPLSRFNKKTCCKNLYDSSGRTGMHRTYGVINYQHSGLVYGGVGGYEFGVCFKDEKIGVWEVSDTSGKFLGYNFYINDTLSAEAQFLNGRMFSIQYILMEPSSVLDYKNYIEALRTEIISYHKRGRLHSRGVWQKGKGYQKLPRKSDRY